MLSLGFEPWAVYFQSFQTQLTKFVGPGLWVKTEIG